MNKTFLKTVFRDFKKNITRFIAIIAIMALGVGFLIGLLSATPVLQRSLDYYYDEQNVFDLQIKSTIGFDPEDMANLKKDVSFIEDVEGFYQRDFTTEYENKEITTRLITTSMDSHINRIRLIEGSFPSQPGECLVLDLGVFQNVDCIGKIILVDEK